MITPSAAFTEANSKLQKKPIFIIVIGGYPRIFTTRPGNEIGLTAGFTFTFPNGETVTVS